MNIRFTAEESEQVKVINYLKALKQKGHILDFWATSNEVKSQSRNGGANYYIGRKMLIMGKRAGVSDLTILLDDFTLYIEMKAKPKLTKTGKISTSHTRVSPSQNEFIETVNKSKHSAGFVAYGARMAIFIINETLKRRTRAELGITHYELSVKDCI